MSLVKSLNSGVSGLNAFQTKMDTIGNNIANVNTTGFKSSSVSFSEMMSEDVGGAGGGKSAPSMSNQVGLGVRVADISRDFSQGSFENTGKETDLAIEGDGFFLVNDGTQNLMTRSGNFEFNSDGYLVDSDGRFVQGYNTNAAGNIVGGGATENVKVDFENALAPQQTDQVTLAGNLNSNTSTYKVLQTQSSFTTASGNIATGTTLLQDLSQYSGDASVPDMITIDLTLTDTDGTVTNFSQTYDPTTTNLTQVVSDINGGGLTGEVSIVDGMLVLRADDMGSSDMNISVDSTTTNFNFPAFQTIQEGEQKTETMSTTVYDDLGQAHSLILNFTQVAEGEWDYEASFADGETITAGPTGTVNFDSMGQITSGGTFNISFDPGGGANNMTFDVALGDASQGTEFTQYAGANTAKVVDQDGYAQGTLVDINIDGDGRVQGVYNNGENMDLAQLALGEVENQHGLDMVSGGLFIATSAAGQVFIDTAANLANTEIKSGTLEGSNVDLAKEFTEMITSQRAYQSNARVITTSDEMLTEAVNLKR